MDLGACTVGFASHLKYFLCCDVVLINFAVIKKRLVKVVEIK